MVQGRLLQLMWYLYQTKQRNKSKSEKIHIMASEEGNLKVF